MEFENLMCHTFSVTYEYLCHRCSENLKSVMNIDAHMNADCQTFGRENNEYIKYSC